MSKRKRQTTGVHALAVAQHASRKSRCLVLGGAALIAALALWTYYPSLNGGFIFDDHVYLTDSPLIKAPNGLQRFWFSTEPVDYWPMTNSSFWLEWRLWGGNTAGYHVSNLVLHIAAALLLWEILSRLSIPGAFLAALLFAVHPVNVESVAWIAQRKNTLAMLFFLLSILWYLRADDESSDGSLPKWYWFSLLVFLLAMLSKGSVAILPLMLLLIVWWQRRQICKSDLLRTAPFFLVAAILTGVNIWFQTHGTGEVVREVTFTQRLLQAGSVVWFYLAKALVPIKLIFFYPLWDIQAGNLLWWLPLVAAATVTLLLMFRLRSSQANWIRPLLFAWLFFGVALAPAMGFFDPGYMRFSLVADHYQHLALLAVVSPIAAGITLAYEKVHAPLRSAVVGAAVLLVGIFTGLSWQQCHLYDNDIHIYEVTLKENPNCWLAHVTLGNALAGQGKIQESIAHYVEAIKIKPDLAEAHLNLANCLSKTGQPQQAIEEYNRALDLNPNYSDAHTNLAIALASEGKDQEAIEHYQQAVQFNPNSLRAQNNLGNILARLGRPREAIEHLQAALRIDPESAIIHNNLGATLADLGRYQEAIEHYQRAIQLDSKYARAYFNLAKASAKLDQSVEAIAAAKRGLAIARNTERTALVQQIETWLKNYQASLPNPNETAPPKLTPSAP